MKKVLFVLIGIGAAASAAFAQADAPTPQPSASSRTLYYAIISAGMPPYTPTQLGPFQDLAACQAAVAAGKKAHVIGDATCVADRTS